MVFVHILVYISLKSKENSEWFMLQSLMVHVYISRSFTTVKSYNHNKINILIQKIRRKIHAISHNLGYLYMTFQSQFYIFANKITLHVSRQHFPEDGFSIFFTMEKKSSFYTGLCIIFFRRHMSRNDLFFG